MLRKILFSLIVLLEFTIPMNIEATQLSYVESFTPQGIVKSPEQVVANFSTPMVPLGPIPEIEPFMVDCPIKGNARWIDTKTWVYDFHEPLPSGITCSFILKKGLKDLSGNETQSLKPFIFNTGGPQVLEILPYEGTENIDERQVFLIKLDGPAKKDSLARNAYCSITGLNERIGVNILDEDSLSSIVTSIREEGFIKGDYVFALECIKTLPNRSEVKIVWQKGIESPSGLRSTKDQVFAYKVREVFRAKFSCQRESPQSQCIPLLPMTVRFTAPIAIKDAERASIKTLAGRTYKAALAEYDREEGFVHQINFKGPFSENQEYLLELPKDIKDDSGRPLTNQRDFPMKVKTGPYPPLAKFSSRFGIIEAMTSPAIPLTIRDIESPVKGQMVDITDTTSGTQDNMKGSLHKIDTTEETKIIQWLFKAASADRTSSIFKNSGIGPIKNLSIPRTLPSKDMEVIGIPLSAPGFYIAEVQSKILGDALLAKGRTLYAATAALVTNLSVHLKQGRDSSLVWVTNLHNAQPSAEVTITIRNCKGDLLWKGKTDNNGIAIIKKPLPDTNQLPACEIKQGEDTHYDYTQLTALNEMGRGLFVFARKGKDLSFAHTSWDKGIEPWRYNLRQSGQWDNIKAHSILDRPLLRAGETLHMRHIIRKQTLEGLDFLKKTELPDILEIRHQGSDQRYEVPIQWDYTGVSLTEWKIPLDAKLGLYQIGFTKKTVSTKTADQGLNKVYPSGSFRVEEFKLPLMRATIKPLKEELVNVSEAELDITLSYLSGGGAKNAPVRLRSAIEPLLLHFKDYDDFEFSSGPVNTGLQRRGFQTEDQEDRVHKKTDTTTTEFTLDDTGASLHRIKGIPNLKRPQRLQVELEFKDPNGEIQTAFNQIAIYPASVLLGISPESWTSSHNNVRAYIAALNIKGNPQEGVSIRVDLFKKRYLSHRKRLIGGFYSYEHLSETKAVGKVCEGKSDNRGLMLCEFTPPETGNLILQAVATDAKGNESISHSEIWVAGKEEQWFDVSDSDRIDLLPEKKSYEPGDRANLQLRMPFKEATALVTVEREGIIDAFVIPISSLNPVISLPIKSVYAPNVFVSALVVRGRISDSQPTAMVDLGKPSFKLGIAEIQVGWKAHQIKVEVKTDKDKYRVREQVKVRLKVTLPEGQKFDQSKTRVNVAVVDEGLLELMPNKSWDILQSMMEPRGYQVYTATAQTQVVGKRHFGMKALPHGGGGGRQVTRELFDTLVYWNNNITLDDKGEAEVAFNLNDSISSFRIAAIVNADRGLFGSGYGHIRTWQDIMLFSGLPRMVREGDQYRAVFTVRNSSQRDVKLNIKALLGLGDNKVEELKDEYLELSSGNSSEIGWPVEAPKGRESIEWTVKAKVADADQEDVIRVKQRIYSLYQAKTVQKEFFQLDRPVNIPIKKPEGMLNAIGGIELSAKRSLIGAIDTVTGYMNLYPYTCLEQRVSKAVTMADKAAWGQIINELPSYMDDKGLLKYFPSMPLGSDILTSYVLSLSNEASFELPDYLLQRMQEGLKAFIDGRIYGYSPLETSDLSIRKLSALEALSRYGLTDPTSIAALKPDSALLPTSALIDWINIIRRVQDLQDRDKKYIEAVNNLTSRFVYHGTTAGLSTERTDRLWWLMVSPDVNILRTVLTFVGDKEWKSYMPRLMRGAIARQKAGHWDSTTANAWGVLALKRFSSIYESEILSGKTLAVKQGETREIRWTEKSDPYPIYFKWGSDTKSELSLRHEGKGAPWISLSSIAAIPVKSPVYNGYTIQKTYHPVEQRNKGSISIGDKVLVKIGITASTDMAWVAIKDPLPGGAVIITTGLLSEPLENDKKIIPAFEEKAADSYRAYFDFLPKGKWTVQYIIRLNTVGVFNMPETRIEALYSPELYGEVANQRFVVKQ